MNERKRVQVEFNGVSRTKRSMKDATDVNGIMSRYIRHGVIPVVNEREMRFGDFTKVEDYQTSLNKVLQAKELFDALPAVIRKRFGNDPVELLKFVNDKSNISEAIELGLIKQNKPVTGEAISPMDDVVHNNDTTKVVDKKAEAKNA